MALPTPNGPFPVGSVVRRLTDSTRPAHLLSAAKGRKLLVKVWYPAQPPFKGAPERLWDELQDPHRTPLLVRASLQLLQRRCASYANASLASNLPGTSVVIYNHGLVSFASENTSLMQELASRGYVVIAVEHEEQLAEFRALSGAQSRDDKKRAKVLTGRLRSAHPEQRAALARNLYEIIPSTPLGS